MNRLTRDQIITRGLDMADIPSLDEHDRPSATIVSTAHSISWLQDALDLFHNEFPWAGIVTSTPLTLDTTGTTALPGTFIMDVRDGLTLSDPKRRIRRWPLQKFITASVHITTTATPERYVILPPNLRVWPTPDKSYSATFWFYSLPSTLGASTVPNFPSDWALVEYVRLRADEWVRKVPPGTAEKYAREKVLELRRSGLAHEPEDDSLWLDQDSYRRTGARNPWDWMGPSVIES